MLGERVSFTESGREILGTVVWHRWPYLYTAVHADDGHLWTIETHRLQGRCRA